MNGNSKYGIDVDVESLGEGSEVELNQEAHNANTAGQTNGVAQNGWNGDGIQVKTDVEMRIEDVRREIEKESMRMHSGQGH